MKAQQPVENILTWHPHPLPDEIFPFWLVEIAAGNGVSLKELFKYLEIINQLGSVDDWRYLGAKRLDQIAELAAKYTGVALEDVYKTMMSRLHGLFGSDQVGPCYRFADPWIMQGKKSQHIYTGQFCSTCLSEAPYLRMSWRISLFVSCWVHRVLLLQSCPRCASPYCEVRKLVIKCIDDLDLEISRCQSCGFDLTKLSTEGAVSEAIVELEDIHESLIRNPRCVGYFSVIHLLLNLVTSNHSFSSAIWNRVSAISGRQRIHSRFELCTAVQRHDALIAMISLFQDWPRAFLELVAAIRPSVSILTAQLRLPEWYLLAVEAGITGKSYEQRRVQDAFWKAAKSEGWTSAAVFLTQGRECQTRRSAG